MLVSAIVAAVIAAPAAFHEEHVLGTWEGSLALPNGASLPLVVRIGQTDGGDITGELDSPAQGATGLPLSEISMSSHVLRFRLAPVDGRFEGRMQDDDTIVGSWTQGGASLPLVLNRRRDQG
ncbi:MAG: hypothetical protein ACK4Z5_02095 [Brevundimonas sp.]